MKSLPPVRSLLSLAVTSALMGTSFIVTHAAEADTTETGTASTSTVLTPAYSVSPTGLMIEITKSQPQALSQSLQTLQPAPVTDGGELLKSLNVFEARNKPRLMSCLMARTYMAAVRTVWTLPPHILP